VARAAVASSTLLPGLRGQGFGDEGLALASSRPPQELVQNHDTVVARIPEPLGERPKRFRDVGRLVEDAFEDLARDVRDRIGIHVVGEELTDHPPRPRRRHTAQEDLPLRRNTAAVNANIGPPRLASVWNRELVDVSPQVADPVQAGCRGVGDDRHVWVVEALPGRPGGIELDPSRTEVEVIGLGRSPDAIDTVRHPLEQSHLDEPGQRPQATWAARGRSRAWLGVALVECVRCHQVGERSSPVQRHCSYCTAELRRLRSRRAMARRRHAGT
jgi:hypothetical protein